MAAVAGILTTELIGAGGNWWSPDASAHVANGAPTARVFAEAAVMAVAESFRLKAFEASGPGAKAFDPAGMKSDETLLKEIKNGRLAMVAFLGFTSQAAVRGLGPIACLKAHLADPGCVTRCEDRAAVSPPRTHALRSFLSICCMQTRQHLHQRTCSLALCVALFAPVFAPVAQLLTFRARNRSPWAARPARPLLRCPSRRCFWLPRRHSSRRTTRRSSGPSPGEGDLLSLSARDARAV